MGTSSVSKFLTLFLMVLIVGSKLIHCTVTYDKKAIIIDGQRRILISGSIHYPRSTPDVYTFLSHFLGFVYILSHFVCCVKMGFVLFL
jgi:hypothetical protein